MAGFAVYRLPYAQQATLVRQTEGEPMELYSCQDLNGRQGFVVAPFEVTPEQPILLIRPDEVEQIDVQQEQLSLCQDTEPTVPSLHYSIDFANFHSQLSLGAFQKIVLARCAVEPKTDTVDPMALFHRACALYPRMFIAMVSTAKSGL